MPSFSHVLWELNSGPHSLMAITFQTEPSPQPGLFISSTAGVRCSLGTILIHLSEAPSDVIAISVRLFSDSQSILHLSAGSMFSQTENPTFSNA